MSTVIMSACWPLQLPPSAKAVLISLADNANDLGECYPSLATIGKRVCLGKTAVIDAIKFLEAEGLLVADRSNGRHSRYTITVGQPDIFSGQPVRQTNRSAKRTGPPGEHNRSATRTAPVRQADTNRQEPSITKSTHSTGKRGSRLPDGWVPSEELKAWAKREYPRIDVKKVVADFVDYWRGVPGAKGCKLDWDATFRLRLRDVADTRAEQYAAPKVGAAAMPYQKPPRPTPEASFQAERSQLAQMLEYGHITEDEHGIRLAAARERRDQANESRGRP